MSVSSSPYARAVAEQGFRERYLSAYRGEAAPLDALWWLEHPGEPSPTGAESPWAAARRRRRRVYAPGATEAELEAARAAERRAAGIRDAAAVALAHAVGAEQPPAEGGPEAALPRRQPRGPRRRLLPLLGVATATAVVAVAVASLPAHHADRPELARSLQRVFPGAAPRPGDLRLALSGDGSETVARSVTGSAPLRVTTVLCRGAGRIEVRLSDRTDDGTRMLCVAGRARLTRLLDAMPASPFLTTVVVSGRVAWSVTVADEHARYDAQTYPRCFGTECS